jgi:hypothetical protein
MACDWDKSERLAVARVYARWYRQLLNSVRAETDATKRGLRRADRGAFLDALRFEIRVLKLLPDVLPSCRDSLLLILKDLQRECRQIELEDSVLGPPAQTWRIRKQKAAELRAQVALLGAN